MENFVEKFKEIKEKGFIKTLRKGPTGVGYTYECELGKEEDNNSLPDLGDRELKCKINGNTKYVRLFSKDKNCWKISRKNAIKKYGSLDSKGRLSLYNFIGIGAENSYGLFVEILSDRAIIRSSTEVIGEWLFLDLVKAFDAKFPAMVLVTADREKIDGQYHYHYNKGMMLDEGSSEAFKEMLLNGEVVLELRLHLSSDGKVRDHGTALTLLNESNLDKLFKNKYEI